jgi:hypothetical protein
MSVREKFKQYGLFNFLLRSFLSIIRRLGISIERWLICNQKIDSENFNVIGVKDRFRIKRMTLNDFNLSNKFNDKKLTSFKKRFEKESFLAYGVYDKKELAYYCWVSLKEFQFSNDLYSMELESTQGLLFDAFCFPEYRGNKLHNYMNIYRLRVLREYDKTEAVVILLNQNIPARKSQKRAGFSCSKQITTYSVFGKKGYYITNKKIIL